MAVGDQLLQDLKSDETNKALAIQARQVGGSDARAGAVVHTERKLPAKPAALLENKSAADTGDISSDTGYLDVENSMYLASFVDFDDAGAQAVICLALYDASDDLIGITESYTFVADMSLRDGASGPYVSPRYVFDVSGASRVKAIVRSLTTGAVINIFLMKL
jgi:hypothetical protein